MEVASNPDHADSYREPGTIRLMPGPRELAAIVAFWTGYALLTIANRFFDPGAGQPGSIADRALIAAIEALCWILLTPILFWLVGRIDFESSRPTGHRWVGLVTIALVAVLAALVLGFVGRELRAHLAPLSPAVVAARAAAGERVSHGPPLWFGFVNALILALGVVAAGVARAYSLRLRSRREQAIHLTSQLAEARLDALRRQLDPHFLFNTLNAIASLVERDPRGVRRMIARLGDLLRYSFEGGREPEVTLRRELDLLGLYVDIVKVRFQDRLAVSIRVDDDVLDALVPTFILQPLVENAVKHGVERRTEGGSVVVEGSRSGDVLILRVIDDGGADDATAVTQGSSGTGVGLRNTKARLEQLYGRAQRFSLTRDGDRRVIAEVRLPFHVNGGRSAAPIEPTVAADEEDVAAEAHRAG